MNLPEGMPADDDAATARRIVDEVHYLVLSTADAQGRPWCSPVWFAPLDLDAELWVSRPGATHSRNVVARPDVAYCIFDSTQPDGTGLGVYARAVAGRVEGAGLASALAAYSARSVALGLDAWDEPRLDASALALYRADVTELSLLPGRGIDERVPLRP